MVVLSTWVEWRKFNPPSGVWALVSHAGFGRGAVDVTAAERIPLTSTRWFISYPICGFTFASFAGVFGGDGAGDLTIHTQFGRHNFVLRWMFCGFKSSIKRRHEGSNHGCCGRWMHSFFLWTYFRRMIGLPSDHTQTHWESFCSSLLCCIGILLSLWLCFRSSSTLISCLGTTSSFIYIWSIASCSIGLPQQRHITIIVSILSTKSSPHLLTTKEASSSKRRRNHSEHPLSQWKRKSII